MTIKTTNDNLIKALTGITNENVSIGDVTIDRKRLLECLKLYPESVLNIDYGSVTWFDNVSEYKDKAYFKTTIDDQACIQIRLDRQIIRFLNRPKLNKRGLPYDVTPLNFTESIIKTELTGYTISVKALLEALNFTAINIASEDSRPVLNAILFESDGSTLKLIAADGFRLGVANLTVPGIGTNKALITLTDITKLLKFIKALKPSGKGKTKVLPDVNFNFTDKGINFTSDNGKLELVSIDGNFPKYQSLIPENGTKIEFIASDMFKALKALKAIAKDGSGIIRLQFYAGKVVLTSRSEELGDSSVECDAIVESDCRIACNVQYLSELMNVCGNSKVSLKITKDSSPALFEVDGNISVIMPMAVQWESKPEIKEAVSVS
jgi:DNA polymerase III sliding clamp (beta) subunit (PCNA family)